MADAKTPKASRAPEADAGHTRTDSKSESGRVCALEIWVYPERLDNGSRMSGDVHVRFCKGLRVQFPRSTYPYTSRHSPRIHMRPHTSVPEAGPDHRPLLPKANLQLINSHTSNIYFNYDEEIGCSPIATFFVMSWPGWQTR